MNTISSFLPNVSSIQKNLPFNLSATDKLILAVAAAIFALIAVNFVLKTIIDFRNSHFVRGYHLGQSQMELNYAIVQLQQDPSKPPRVSIDNLLKLAQTHGSIIKHLDLYYQEIPQEQFIEIIKLCPNLESLKVFSLNQLNNSCCPYLEKLTKLQKLTLICPKISDYKFLASLTKLQDLHLAFETIDDHTLEHIKDLSSLKSLLLCYKKNITEKSLQPISQLKNLEILDFTYSTDNSSTASCPHVTDAHLIPLSDLIHLKFLNFSNSQITDAGLASLGKLASLEVLDINGCKNITDRGLEHLKKMTTLQKLNCSSNGQITPQGLVHLASLPALKSLNLMSCKNISKNDVTNAGITCKVAVE